MAYLHLFWLFHPPPSTPTLSNTLFSDFRSDAAWDVGVVVKSKVVDVCQEIATRITTVDWVSLRTSYNGHNYEKTMPSPSTESWVPGDDGESIICREAASAVVPD
ncbi:Uncharacterized protein Fot_54904 [Forsythia ovata]|uniref:Uncharacterized protein n=1 Tax=Forsythia ovata TaxID=205694 RepID=A0ABD1P5R0_9LAMI